MRVLYATICAVVSVWSGPAAGAPADVERCGTWIALRATTEAVSAVQASRPVDTPLQLDSAHFRVHYAIPSQVTYASNVLEAAERSYAVLIDTLGYRLPPADGGGGGDDRTDYYVQLPAGFGGAWGRTLPETLTGSPFPGSATSWVEVVDTLAPGRLRTVVSHEYFHVIQLGYDRDENTSFLEMISTWAEDRVYDDINAYLEVLPGFFDRPEKAMFSHVYSNFPWMIYLTENFGESVLEQILEGCGLVNGNNVIASSDSVLGLFGTGFVAEFNAFAQWNFFTGARDDGQHYREGASFPEIAIEKTVECLPLDSYATLHRPGGWATNYFVFRGDRSSDSLRLVINPEFFAETAVVLTRFKDSAATTEVYSFPQFTTADSISLSNWGQCDSLLLTYAVGSTIQPVNTLTLSARHVTATAPQTIYLLVLDRDDCLRPFDGSGDDFTTVDGQDYAFVRALEQLNIPYVLSRTIPPDLSLCGGIVIVAGHDGNGGNLTVPELSQLMAYMDVGGDVWLESNRLGEWYESGGVEQAAFWAYFGCSFQPGNTMGIGNVSAWRTIPSSPLGAMQFDYDAMDPPDDLVGSLIPSAADTIALDQADQVRVTARFGPAGSVRVCSTIMLGGSTGAAPGSTRASFVQGVMDLFDAIVPALSASITVTVRTGVVEVAGVVEGYDGQVLTLRRSGPHRAVEVPLAVSGFGDRVTVLAVDQPQPGSYSYTLRARAGTDGEQVLLWQAEVSTAQRLTRAVAVFPNPARRQFTVRIDAERDQTARLRVYDVAGRRVHEEVQAVRAGSNWVSVDSGDLRSGVYFVTVSLGREMFERKLIVVR